VEGDPKRSALLAEQAGAEERQVLASQARGFERLGDLPHALQAYRLLAKHYPNTADGRKAAEEAERLADFPYLGVAFAAGEPVRVAQVVAKGPADRAGVKAGDVLVELAGKKVGSPKDVRETLRDHKPGDRVKLEVRRGDEAVTLTAELGALPAAED
jgi:predicted metalloprotease with PDZ domain